MQRVWVEDKCDCVLSYEQLHPFNESWSLLNPTASATISSSRRIKHQRAIQSLNNTAVCVSVCVCVCVCEREGMRERGRESRSVCMDGCVWKSVCVYSFVRVSMYLC